MKKYEGLRPVAAILLLLEFPSTCPLPTTAGEANPTVAGDRNPGKAVAGKADPARASRGADREGEIRGTETVTVPNLVADREPESVAAAVKTPLQNVLVAEGVTEAVLHNEHHQVAFATDGKRTVSAPDTIRKSANSSTLAALPLLSLRKEKGEISPPEGLKALNVAPGQTHRIPATTRIN